MYKQIVVAGMGRCGTSLVLNAVCRSSGRGHRWVTSLADAPRLSPKIIKTHDFAPSYPVPSSVKFIYLFGNPMQIICSAERKGGEFLKKHYPHMNANYSSHADIYIRDTMRLAENLRSWQQASWMDVLMLRYETLWDYQEKISDFLGFEVVLPEYRKRSSDWEAHPKRHELILTYGDLNACIELLPDCECRLEGSKNWMSMFKYHVLNG